MGKGGKFEREMEKGRRKRMTEREKGGGGLFIERVKERKEGEKRSFVDRMKVKGEAGRRTNNV